ncbi:MAG: hypothetical protein AB4426_28850 [Xenococcaceae cyanobacterium]
MSNDKPKVQFRASQITHAAPKSLKFLDYLQLALEGGNPTFDFFSGDFGALQELAQIMAKQGDAAWTQVDKASSLKYDFLDPDKPAAYVKGTKGTMVLQFHASEEVLGQHTTNYKQAGIATTYLVTDQGPVDVIISYIEKLGPPIGGAAIAPAILTILGAFKNFFQSFISRAFNAASEGATEAEAIGEEAAEEAAEDAAVEGEVIADELVLSISFGPLAIAGIVVAAIILVVSAILFFLAKTMTCFAKVYNFTDQQVTLNICYQHDLEIKEKPKTGILPPVGIPPAPPGVTALDKVIYRADYILLNSNDLKGLGVVIQAPGNTQNNPADFPGLTAMIDIPAVGDNSLYVNLDGNMNCNEVWDNLSGTFKKLSKSTCRGDYRIYIATNQLSGKSSSPINGDQTGYFYEYLIVIEKDGFFFDYSDS